MFRPRIKWEHRPVRLGDGRIRIGAVRGIEAAVVDPDGWVWALLETLDGTRTMDQVVADLVHAFPDRSEVEVRATISDLIREGYLEDAAEPVLEGLSAAERERYGRGRGLWRWMDRTPRRTSWDVQLLLRQARVVVVGIGGVGGVAAWALVASGVGHVHCVEPDVVELSNLNRQLLFTEDDVGRSKVEAAVQRLRAHNQDVQVTGEQLVVDGPTVLRRLAARFDVLLLAADKPAGRIRSWANLACRETGTAWVHGGYDGPQVSIGLYRPGGGGPCHDCLYAEQDARQATLPPRTEWSPGTGSGAAPQAVNAITATIAGSKAAHAVMSLITGVPTLRTDCQYGYNIVTLQSRVVGLSEPSPLCPTCGPHP
ncbi:molybdopterin/thiamine biosynthesis adenylyltransferase [Saccharothrix carnea]|uniref:Molybdopterin/thiamine biosynthesis adenylyltransferase n=1 Tax=Saccharothrix carnea TaxID=1280637 RepID=A0A2P8I4A0_SACCR|nr:ThiF family adenylyltransferase [Saccharothrix carnea]PSL53296.1 molybdopterin/thiamine biosynthesis adenylyltransferase [Saccharothrix carnea]